jgi:methyl-accepting chemotaxis protein
MDLDPRSSYGGKVVVGFLVVVLVGGSVGAVLVTGIQSEIRSEKTSSLTAESNLQEDTVSTLLGSLRARTVSLAESVRSIRAGAAGENVAQSDIRSQFVQRAARSNATGVVTLADDDDGTVLVSSESNLEGTSLSRLGYDPPEGLSPGETVVRLSVDGGVESWMIYTRTTSGDLLLHQTPLSFVESELNGVLAESDTRIVDSDGRIVYDSVDPDRVGSQHVAGEGVNSPAVAAGFEASTPGTRRLAPEESPLNETTLSAYAGVEGTEWTVVSYTRPASLFSTAQLVWRDLLILLAVVGVLLGGYALTVERPAARRMRTLGDAVGRLQDRELDTELDRTRGDELGELAEGLDVMRQNLASEIDRAQTARADAETARADAEALSEELVDKADNYADSLSRVAAGDFTVRVDPDSDHEAMRTVGETLNETVAQLETTVAAVQSFAADVADSMDRLSANADQIETVAGDVDERVREISADADEQRDRLRSVGTEMDDLSATVEEVAATMDGVADNAQRAGEIRKEGREAAEEAATALDEIQTETEEAVAAVEALVDRVGEIAAFADVIADVADQTDMLALNANVEAARTDTDSDGFAVVADEIKALAEEAGDRADDIERLIAEVETQSETTADRMRAAGDRLAASNETIERAIESFYEIDEAVAEVNDGIEDVSRATDEQAASTEEVAATVEEVTDIAERTAGLAETVAAATDEQTTATHDVSRTADEIASAAADLSETVEQFEVDVEGGDATADATDIGTGAHAPDGGEE